MLSETKTNRLSRLAFVALQIVLVLALVAVAWPAQAASSPATKTPSMKVTSLNNGFKVEIVDFSGNTHYNVRIAEGWGWGNTWYKVGRLATNKAGKASGSWRMPKQLKDEDTVTVCIKNMLNDDVWCQTIVRSQAVSTPTPPTATPTP